MDRFFQWVWDRCGRVFPWAIFVLVYVSGMTAYLAFSLIIVAFEDSHRYGMAVLVTAVALLVRAYIFVLPFSREMRLVQRWAAGDRTDPVAVLRATFTFSRKAILRVVVTDAVWATLLGGLGALWLLLPKGVPARWLGGIMLLPLFLLPSWRPADDGARIVVLDVGREAFFDGTLALPAEGAELGSDDLVEEPGGAASAAPVPETHHHHAPPPLPQRPPPSFHPELL